jgi:acyl-CoA dehydrogenase
MFEGHDVIGIRLNWHKRYITLGPIATVLGLAFKLHDPDHLLSPSENIGITVALVPTRLPGVDIGRRHFPSFNVFQNGPNAGRDVFVPMDHVIGGVEQVGKGWKMLMSALAAGRGVSLPSLSAAGAVYTAHTTGAYARIREQFHIPIGKFEAIQERLGRLAGTAYLIDAARRMTCAALDAGHKPAVITAIMKSQATERLRVSVNDAMDVHGGKAIMEGPHNYLGSLYRAVPIGITVEGANIVTRSLIQFGQGAIRSHPYILKEILALEDDDQARGLDAFDRAFWGHVGHAIGNALRAWAHAWTGGMFAPAPRAGKTTCFYRQLGRYAAAFALSVDLTLLTMGGDLKRKEMISARFGDLLSELYLLSAVLKRWRDEGRQDADLPVVAWCMDSGLATIAERFDEIFTNLPNRLVASLLRFLIQPVGPRRRGPTDRLTRDCAAILLEPSATRDRLTVDLFHPRDDSGLARLERAFRLTSATQPLRDRLHKAHIHDFDQARKQNLISDGEAMQLLEAEKAVAAAIDVDDFTADELTHHDAKRTQGGSPSPVQPPPRPAAAE